MAQAVIMGPPLSPRETRRSGRRSAPSASASTSKSPDSLVSEAAPRNKESTTRPALSTANSNGRAKRPKQEDLDDPIPHKNAQSNGGASNHGSSNGRAKRKGKEKDKLLPPADQVTESASTKLNSSTPVGGPEPQEDDAEEQGITRCICGMNEEDADGGEFMVQCESCNVWQHGLCMGFQSDEQLPEEYYCEQCKPDRHQELFKRLAKKARQSSTHSHHTTSRLSRSHSPTHLLKPPKRRNTMNSRDAAFDESLKELIEATAAEAAAATEGLKTSVNGSVNGLVEAHDDDSGARKKRKRGEEDAAPKKRTRSASSASDCPKAAEIVAREDLPPPPKRSSGSTAKSGNSRNRRGGGSRKVAANVDTVISGEGDEVPAASKRLSQNNRGKVAPTPKRPPPSSHTPGNVVQDQASRRNYTGGGTAAGSSIENSRAYRNSHAFAVSQQPFFTSWNLPDYLAHLEHMLPTDIPRPLEVRGSGVGPGGRESIERTMERGVRVKWPSKRMSVGDMNKRVRALVEWVGREQAGALDRGRRREALEKALRGAVPGRKSADPFARDDATGGGSACGSSMIVDNTSQLPVDPPSRESVSVIVAVSAVDSESSPSTMKMMEELMEELITFQERFGPAVKNRE
ncbi:hypothetical protein F5I97DRAFT_2003858 [Phlebopus sp. FC_14]|nr:hypothetical protein F5I97DRAFT_2003858 [Phlebopus sp. FC_14]